MASNTETILSSVNWAKFFLGNRPFFLDVTMEPALTSANIIAQTMLQPPFKWRWNRVATSFLMVNATVAWQNAHAYSAGFRRKDSNGNMQTVTTGGTSAGSEPVWSTTVGGTTTDNTVIWTMSGLTDYVQTLPNFGFIEKATVTGVSGTALGVITEIPTITTELSTDAGSGRPHTIAPIIDDNAGNITFRFMPGVPDQPYSATVLYQKKAALMTAVQGTGGTWPIPDEYSNVYNYGFLSLFMLFADDARYLAMNQKFTSGLLGLAEGLNEQQKAVFLGEWEFLMRSAAAQMKQQMGVQGRGQ